MWFVYPRNTKELRARYKVYVQEIELEFEMLVFEEGGKPGEKPSEQGQEPTTNSTHIWKPGPGIEPRSHWWEASAFTTALSLLSTNTPNVGCYF